MALRTFAAIDVGSSDLELGIYEISMKFGVRRIDHIRHKIALGRTTFHEGKISYELVEELCEVLKDFTAIMESYKVAGYQAYATSAMRQAKNSRIVVDQIRVRTGLEVQIISNSEQRLLGCMAIAVKDIEFQKIIQDGTAIIDVGFGSMQLSLFEYDVLVSTQNIPMGVMQLKETMTQIKALQETEYELLEEMIGNELITFRKLYLKGRDITNLIAIGETLIPVIADLERRGSSRQWIAAEEFLAFCGKIWKMPLDIVQERLEINAESAAMLLAGLVIYKQVLEMTGAKMIWLPGISLVDGIAAEYGENFKLMKLNHDFNNDIIAAARNMARRYKCHMAHIQAVEKMALAIFDASKKIHGLKARERLLLQIAANLHGCGKFISVRNTGECCYNIIMSTEIIGLSHLEREIVANVVRYHIQEFEYNEVYIQYRPFPGSKRISGEGVNILIAKLTAILRLANAMDQSHRQRLTDAAIRIREKQLVITSKLLVDLRLEELAIHEKADFFEEIFGLRPILRQIRRV